MAPKRRAISKKKVCQIKNEISETDELQNDLMISNNKPWTASEDLKFVNLVLSQFANASYKSYRDGMGEIDWNMVKIENRSEQACRLRLDEMVKQIKKYRTLNEILTEAKHQAISVSGVSDVTEIDDGDSETNAQRNKPKPTTKKKKNTITVTAKSSQQSADVRCLTAERRVKKEPEPDPVMTENVGRKRRNETNGKSVTAKKKSCVARVCGFNVHEIEDDSD